MSAKPYRGERKYYEFWGNPGDPELAASVQRLRNAGARVIIKPVQRDYEQNQFIGNTQ